MGNDNGGVGCALGSWLLAAGVGLLTAILLLVVGSLGWVASLFLGGLAFVLLGLLFNWLFCAPLPKMGEVKPGQPSGLRAVPHGAAAPAHGASAGAAPASAASSTSARSASGGAGATASTGSVGATAASGGAGASASAGTAKVDGTGAGAASAGGASGSAGGAGTSGAKSGGASGAGATAQPLSGAVAATAAGAGAGLVKATPALAGEAELGTRKGNWKYGGDAAPAKAAASAAASPAADEGVKPKSLSAAREGGPDDLKRIKGIGPKLEKLCHTLGFYHFDQIAAWTSAEVAWVDANLEGFKGRVTRDNWVEQAKLLASGAETEFSKRVDKGDVY